MVRVTAPTKPRQSSRLHALDLLRGFFIVVIIIDHFYRWPSLLGFISGQGELWVTAGEGFVIISGLLIGYVRGYKNRELPMLEVAKKVWKRALLLYGWLVGLTIIYTVFAWYGHFLGPTTGISIPSGHWSELIIDSFLTSYRHPWIYFLYFYTFLLAFSPVVIYLLRHKNIFAVFAFTIVTYAIGRLAPIEWLQWTPLFYLPAMAGYYLPNIQVWWSRLSAHYRQTLSNLLFVSVGLTVVFSVVYTFIVPMVPVAQFMNGIMTKQDFFPLARIPISLLWFIGFVMLFEKYKIIIDRCIGWLLLPFGTRSLTAYIVHGTLLFVAAAIAPVIENIWYNTTVGLIIILTTWLLVRSHYVQRVIPQ